MELENKDILERSVSEKMCSSGSNGVGEICSPGTADTCRDSHSSDEKSPVNQRVAPICGKNGCVFQFPQKTHAETDLPQG